MLCSSCRATRPSEFATWSRRSKPATRMTRYDGYRPTPAPQDLASFRLRSLELVATVGGAAALAGADAASRHRLLDGGRPLRRVAAVAREKCRARDRALAAALVDGARDDRRVGRHAMCAARRATRARASRARDADGQPAALQAQRRDCVPGDARAARRGELRSRALLAHDRLR